MPVSKNEVYSHEAIFAAACERLDAMLKERKEGDEPTYFDIEDLPDDVRWRIRETYEALGWTITYEECAGEYEDYWFS